jgi:23S rRNA (cytosine1962-C5)-methyltransferase
MNDPVANALPVLRLKRNEDKRLRAGHLWVFSNEVDTAATPLTSFTPGAAVRIVNHREAFVGYGCINPQALICARILSRNADIPVGHTLLVKRLRSALALRQRLYADDCYRLVFGESDGLPGLVLDRYGDVIVGQIATLGMELMRADIETAIQEVIAPRVLVWKNDSSARDLEGLPHEISTAGGAEVPPHVEVVEAGSRLQAPLADGQKTGWFYDQTGNRERLRRYLPKGARVLDVCSYVGAWGLTALHHGAASATCVDSSQAALDWVQRNAAANGLQVTTHRGDAFAALDQLRAAGERFDVVIVDPPAFIKRRRDLPQGEAAYRKINQLAMRMLGDDGLLVSCSCSWHLPQESMPAIVQAAASLIEREARILEFGGQSPDHPVHPAIPETRYLKAVFCRITR